VGAFEMRAIRTCREIEAYDDRRLLVCDAALEMLPLNCEVDGQSIAHHST
jgi:hypothetical protein